MGVVLLQPDPQVGTFKDLDSVCFGSYMILSIFISEFLPNPKINFTPTLFRIERK